MTKVFFIILCLILVQFLKGSAVAEDSDEFCPQAREQEEECGPYAHTIVKPMMAYFDQVNRKIDENAVELENKNSKIRKLEEREINLQSEVAQLRLEIARGCKDAIIKSHEDHIESLKKQIEPLTNTNGQQFDKLAEKQKKEIDGLKKQLKLYAESEVVLETDLEHKGAELESLKKQVSHLTNSLNKQNKELTKLKEQIKQDAEKINLQTEAGERNNCLAFGSSTGVHNITLSDGYTYEVLCNSDIAGPGWTVIQQRVRGGVDFRRNWNSYRNGFGDFWNGDFFVGLETIHRLTKEQPHELYIHMEDFQGNTFFAFYDAFSIAGENESYKLTTLGKFSGTKPDRLSNSRGCAFLTNEGEYQWPSLADIFGGFWYCNFSDPHLNGQYYNQQVKDWSGVTWDSEQSLKTVKMLIRPKDVSN